MHSSTSNSDARLPQADWRRAWLWAIGFFAVVLGGGEALWRWNGFTPSVPDDVESWAVARQRLSEEGVAILGTSRIQAAIDPAVWAEEWEGVGPIQLAIPGASPLPVLEHVAQESAFRGLVVFEVLPGILFGNAEALEADAQRWIDAYGPWSESPASISESRIRGILGESFVTLRLSPLNLAKRSFLRSDPWRIPYFSMTADRFLRLDFAKANLPRRIDVTLRNIELRGGPAPETLVTARIERLAAAATVLREREAEVVLVHMPHDAAVREREVAAHPRSEYWERLTERTGLPSIHYEDDPELSRIGCPDGSHIDVADTAPFTRALVARIRSALARGNGPRRMSTR